MVYVFAPIRSHWTFNDAQDLDESDDDRSDDVWLDVNEIDDDSGADNLTESVDDDYDNAYIYISV